MKKHNEGYALALVLVVLVVVCLVAVSILSASLSNLKSQQASVARMQAQYEAQGKIEQVVADLKNEFKITTSGVSAEQVKNICKKFAVYQENSFAYNENPEQEGDDTISFSVAAVDTKNSVQISCTIILMGKISENGQSGGTKLYNITEPQIGYSSYKITTITTEQTNAGEESEPA